MAKKSTRRKPAKKKKCDSIDWATLRVYASDLERFDKWADWTARRENRPHIRDFSRGTFRAAMFTALVDHAIGISQPPQDEETEDDPI